MASYYGGLAAQTSEASDRMFKPNYKPKVAQSAGKSPVQTQPYTPPSTPFSQAAQQQQLKAFQTPPAAPSSTYNVPTVHSDTPTGTFADLSDMANPYALRRQALISQFRSSVLPAIQKQMLAHAAQVGTLGSGVNDQLYAATAEHAAGNLEDQLTQLAVAEAERAAARQESLQQQGFTAGENERNRALQLLTQQNDFTGRSGLMGQEQAFAGEQAGLDRALREEAANREFGLQQGQLTGLYQGAPTLAAQQATKENALREAALTGLYNGAPTLGSQELQAQRALQEGQLTGLYNGQQTIGAQQLAQQKALQQQQLYQMLGQGGINVNPFLLNPDQNLAYQAGQGLTQTQKNNILQQLMLESNLARGTADEEALRLGLTPTQRGITDPLEQLAFQIGQYQRMGQRGDTNFKLALAQQLGAL